MSNTLIFISILIITLLLSVHALAQGPSLPTEEVEEVRVGDILRVPKGEGKVYGIASYYGRRWDGRRTANMEIYDSSKLTCASPILPFNTLIKVTNLENNKSVIVRVNDRGPYKMHRDGKVVRPLVPHPKRVLDLSRGAFEVIGNTDDGLLKISYVVLD